MQREVAADLDTSDALRGFRDEFVIVDDGLIYFDGNSLGRLPRRTVAALQACVVEQWGAGLVRSWERWVDLPEAVGDRLGAAVLGAAPGQVVVCDTTTANLDKLVRAAVAAGRQPGRNVLVAASSEFPTDRYVLDGIAAGRGLSVELAPSPDAVAGTVARLGPAVAVVVLSLVDYRTAGIADVGSVGAAAAEAGATVVWDLSHAAGAVEVDLDGWGVDLAVGCTYKYLNGGPGAPAWLYVRSGLQDRLVPPVWGWFGNDDQFAMGPQWQPAPGMRRWLTGTPSPLGLVAVDAGVALLASAGMRAVAAKGRALTALAASLAAEWLAPLGFELASPADPSGRGSHIALRHPESLRLTRALIEEADVIPDFRGPDLIRVGLAPLTTRFVDVWDGFDRLRALAVEEAWRRYDASPGRVT
jgi:kynureninase